tara:strand:+ start:184 stop:429 length:246 start_codon:yes stop_codon:yes gene_type:complete
MSDDRTKQEYIGNFIKAIAAVEAEMLPLQEHRKDLKASYIMNDWLTKEEMSAAMRAYRMLKNDESIEELLQMYENVSKVPY